MANKMHVSKRVYNGWGNFSLSEDKDGRIKLEDNYFCTEQGEDEFEFDKRYYMERADYIKGIKELAEKGSCGIPVSEVYVWPGDRSSDKKHVGMRMENGVLKVDNEPTPWTLSEISVQQIDSESTIDDVLEGKND